jgi:hypothetical protein
VERADEGVSPGEILGDLIETRARGADFFRNEHECVVREGVLGIQN